jgi:predicted acyltransferase
MEAVVIKERLKSLDALRGFDMFWIIGGEGLFLTLKNFSHIPFIAFGIEQMDHVSWNGFHFMDLIFPLFLFLAGLAMPFSLKRQLEKGVPKKEVYLHIFKRTLILILFGILINGVQVLEFHKIRFASVLGQIGIAYMFGALIFLNFDYKKQIIWVVGILVAYWAMLKFIPVPGVGAGVLTMEGSLNGYIDRLFMPGHLYREIHDPEGWLVKIPATATALLGALTGAFIKEGKYNGYKKAGLLLIAGTVFLILSRVLDPFFPINKNLWTSTFVLHTAGWSLLLFSLFYFVIDVLHFQKWAFPFVVIGMNSITIYLAVSYVNFGYTANALFGSIVKLIPVDFQPFTQVIFLLLVEWCFLYFLYRKKIFLRV